MQYDPDKHHRRSIRLRDYDYSQAGAYFVTICTLNRCCTLGEIIEAKMELNGVGNIVDATWVALSERYPNIRLDEYIVMPNHLHGILFVGVQFIAPASQETHDAYDSCPGAINSGVINHAPTKALTLGEIVRAFKAVTTQTLRHAGFQDFSWQRNYYEHIIRDEVDLKRIRTYIVNNPGNWMDDSENPMFVGT